MTAKSGSYQFKLEEIIGADSGQIQYLAKKLREYLNRLEPIGDHPEVDQAKNWLADMHNALTRLEVCASELTRSKAVTVQQLNRASAVQ